MFKGIQRKTRNQREAKASVPSWSQEARGRSLVVNDAYSYLTAAKLVDELKHKAREQQVLLQQKQVEADQALVEITESMQRASNQKAEVEKVKASLGPIVPVCARLM